jgi:hypothetical protein
MRNSLAVAALAAVAAFGLGSAAQAQFASVLDFEGPDLSGTPDGGEGIGTNNFGGVVSTFGATQGTQALFFDNVATASNTLFDVGTVNGDPVPPNDPERLNNFLAFQTAAAAITAGTAVRLEFDLTFDATQTTAEQFFQLGVFINSELGYQQLGFGGLLGGNIGGAGTFPTLGPAATAGGVTLTTLNPSNFAGGDPIGAVRVSIPVGPGTVLPFGDGPDAGVSFDFAQLGFTMNGGGQLIDLGFDRVGFQIGAVPEPTSLTLLGAAAVLGRRRRRI